MERRRREHGVEDPLRQRNLLESPEVELDGAGVAHALARERDHVRTGIDRSHHEPTLDERFGQLPRAAPDLQDS